jgi:hypothetical protein
MASMPLLGQAIGPLSDHLDLGIHAYLACYIGDDPY